MPTQAEFNAGVVESLVAAAAISVLTIARKWLTEHPPDLEFTAPPKAELPAFQLPLGLPDTPAVSEKLAWLEHRVLNPTEHWPADKEARELSNQCSAVISSLSFLAEGDEIPFDEGLGERLLCLNRQLGDGPFHQTWLATDMARGLHVTIKFLKDAARRDERTTRSFIQNAARISRLSYSGIDIPRTYLNVAPETIDIPFYVADFVPGRSLREVIESGANLRTTIPKSSLVNGMTSIAEILTSLHAVDAINTNLKPDNIVIHDSGAWKIVDYDYLYDFRDSSRGIAAMRNLSYAAPEVLERCAPSPAADVFSMGRIVLYFYKSGALPGPFELTSAEVVDRLNYGIQLKRVLTRATCPNHRDRHQSCSEFMEDLRTAVSNDSEHSQLGVLFLDESAKVFALLRNTFWGTLTAMLVIRPLIVFVGALNSRFLPFGLIQLSDRPIVGAFHGIIGGFVWGTAIPAAFVLYWASTLRKAYFSRAWAMLLCGLAGFVGGIICTLGAVLIPNAATLVSLGWLKTGTTNAISLLDRLDYTIFTSRLFFAFPLTGAMTGIAAGAFLDLKMKGLLKQEVPALTPIPGKLYAKRTGALLSSINFVGTPFFYSLVLLLPLASTLFAFLFKGNGEVNRSAEAMRCFGEGLVHMFGLIGLSIGFFFGILPPPDKESRWNRFMARIRRKSSNSLRRDNGDGPPQMVNGSR